MIDLELFHFLRPQWFVALLPLALLTWFLFFRKGARSNWEAVVDERLLPHILIRGAARTRRAAIILTVTGGLLGIVALAGPAWNKLPQPVFTSQDALVIALDLTLSMDANDVSPSRLERARYKISDILDQRPEGQTALLVYSGAAFTVTPLTDDAETIRSQLKALETGIMPVTGNRTGKAVTLALDLLKQGGMRRGHVLLITDDATPDSAGDSVALLRDEGYRLSVLGVGTSHGAPVLLPDGGFLQDRDGEIVIPVLDEGALRGLAGSGGGIYVRLTKDDRDTRQLTGFFSEAQTAGEQAGAEISADVWREQGPWLVLCLLPLVALLFRRGYLLALALLLFPLPEPVSALDWDGLWLRRDQQGQRAMDARDYTAAAELFDDPAWKAAAQHRAGDYHGALDSLEPLAGAQSNYNRGNALARLGRYHEAIAAYDRTLAERPDHADAKFNKELLEKELERQQQQRQQQQNRDSQQDQQQPGQQPRDQQGQGDQQSGQEQRPEQSQSPRSGDRQDDADRNETPQPEEEQAQRRQQQERGEETQGNGAQQQLAQTNDTKSAEEQQATEQWLRRIPDDPSGLLRRKFLYQYQQRNYEQNRERQTW
ncbi:MAG: VWA domain-containing protein [Gammaproteobacteria bacterium]|nr:VWA domain-containing protein [Gammaproteobacteria bacterium]